MRKAYILNPKMGVMEDYRKIQFHYTGLHYMAIFYCISGFCGEIKIEICNYDKIHICECATFLHNPIRLVTVAGQKLFLQSQTNYQKTTLAFLKRKGRT